MTAITCYRVKFFTTFADHGSVQVDQGWYTKEEIEAQFESKNWKLNWAGRLVKKQYKRCYTVVITEETWVTTEKEEAKLQAKLT